MFRVGVFVFVAVLVLSACGVEKNPVEIEPPLSWVFDLGDSETLMVVATEATKEGEIIPPDWDLSELASDIELNGVKFSLPLSLEEFREVVSKMGAELTVIENEDDEFVKADIVFNGDMTASVEYTKYSPTVFLIAGFDPVQLSVGDIKIGSKKGEILEKYGLPNHGLGDAILHTYLWSDEQVLLLMYDINLGTVEFIMICNNI